MRWLARTLTACAVIATVVHARAEKATSAVSWVRLPGAESCITTPELGERIEKHLGRTALVSPSVADVSIEARAERTASRHFHIVVGGTRRDGKPIGTRELTSSGTDCRALDDDLVLVMALMIDPDAMEPARPGPVAPPAQPPPAAITREVIKEREVVIVDPGMTKSAPWVVDANAMAVAAVQRVPGVAPGVRFGVRVGPNRIAAMELSFGAVPASEVDIGTRRVATTLLEGGLAWCPALFPGRHWAVEGCSGVRLGNFRAEGRGFASDTAVDSFFFDISVGARAWVDVVGAVFVIASATGTGSVVRHQTTATDAAGTQVVLAERSFLHAEFGAGVGVHFSP